MTSWASSLQGLSAARKAVETVKALCGGKCPVADEELLSVALRALHENSDALENYPLKYRRRKAIRETCYVLNVLVRARMQEARECEGPEAA